VSGYAGEFKPVAMTWAITAATARSNALGDGATYDPPARTRSPCYVPADLPPLQRCTLATFRCRAASSLSLKFGAPRLSCRRCAHHCVSGSFQFLGFTAVIPMDSGARSLPVLVADVAEGGQSTVVEAIVGARVRFSRAGITGLVWDSFYTLDP